MIGKAVERLVYVSGFTWSLSIAWGPMFGQKIVFDGFSSAFVCHSISVDSYMSCPVSLNTGHGVVVIKSFTQVGGLAKVNGPPSAVVSCFCEHVDTGYRG